MTFSDAQHLLGVFITSKVKREVEEITEVLKNTSVDLTKGGVPIFIIHKPSLILNFKKYLEDNCYAEKTGDVIRIYNKSNAKNHGNEPFELCGVRRLDDKIKFDFKDVEEEIYDQEWFNFTEEEKTFDKSNLYFTY